MKRRTEMVARGNLEMYAAGLEARVDILEAKLRDRERRIREARRDLERRGVLRLSVSEELLDLRRGRK